MKVCAIYGTRPEIIKLSVLCSKYQIDTLSIDQQPHLTNFYKSLVPHPTYFVNLLHKNLNERFSETVREVGKIIAGYDAIVIQGDTMTAAASAMAAFNLKIKIAHIEAGLRTHDITSPYPEEGYRSIISRISDWHFAPTQNAAKNLETEKVPGIIVVTGNTVIDVVSSMMSKKTSPRNDVVIVTLHRRENIPHLERILKELKKVAEVHKELNWILPVHPNPDVKTIVTSLLKESNIRLVDPIDYPDFIELLQNCRLVITDSGGIQEEAAFIKKRVVVCRESTERPEGIQAGFAVLGFNDIGKTIEDALNMENNFGINPYGDGQSSDMIAKILGLELRTK